MSPTFHAHNDVWSWWNTTSTTASTNDYVIETGTAAWANWNAYSAATTVWTEWTGSNTVKFKMNNARVGGAQTLTPEQVAERDRLHQERLQRVEQQQEELRQAQARARLLLDEVLTPEQQTEYLEHHRFTVRVPDPKRKRSFRTFRVHHGRAGNVQELDEQGRVLRVYCIHLYDGSPNEDTMIAQKLMLETDIERFERVANITRGSLARAA